MTLPSQYDPTLWLAILHEIDLAGGSVQPRNLYPKIRQYFPEITEKDLKEELPSGGNRWTNRIQWARQNLVHRGCLAKEQAGYWILTDLGREWLSSNWKGSGVSYTGVLQPPIIPDLWGQAKQKKQPVQPESNKEPPQERRPEVMVVGDIVGQLCNRLVLSQRKSSAPQQFEQDLTDAFSYLGFTARHIGGSREADIVVTAPLGQLAYSIVLDAKSSQSGRIPDSQINWSVIASYQKNYGATFAAVVGEQFSGGQLRTFADQYGVTLLTTEHVMELVRLHAQTPFTLLDLREIFATPGLATEGIQNLRERHRAMERQWRLIAEIIDTISTFQAQAIGGFALKVDQLYPVLLGKSLGRGDSPADTPTQQDVADAVAFLASRAMSVLADVPGSEGAYQLAMSVDVAKRRFKAFARSIDSSSLLNAGQKAGQVTSIS